MHKLTAAELTSTVDLIQQNSVTLMTDEALEQIEEIDVCERQTEYFLAEALSELQEQDDKRNAEFGVHAVEAADPELATAWASLAEEIDEVTNRLLAQRLKTLKPIPTKLKKCRKTRPINFETTK